MIGDINIRRKLKVALLQGIGVVGPKYGLVLAYLHPLVCVHQQEGKPAGEVGYKPIGDMAQALLDLLRKFTIVVFLMER